jgi:hypothetical protein
MTNKWWAIAIVSLFIDVLTGAAGYLPGWSPSGFTHSWLGRLGNTITYVMQTIDWLHRGFKGSG